MTKPRKKPRAVRRWAGFVEGRMDWYCNHADPDQRVLRPAIFKSRKIARTLYEDVRRVTITESPDTPRPEPALDAACESAHGYPQAVHSKPCSWPACELDCLGRKHMLSAWAAINAQAQGRVVGREEIKAAIRAPMNMGAGMWTLDEATGRVADALIAHFGKLMTEKAP